MHVRNYCSPRTQNTKYLHACLLEGLGEMNIIIHCTHGCANKDQDSVFTVSDTETNTETNKKWVGNICVEVFVLQTDKHQYRFSLASMLIYWCLCLTRCRPVWIHPDTTGALLHFL